MADLSACIDKKRRPRLNAYGSEPSDVGDHARGEEMVLGGGYGYRQILELVQNGADAILEASQWLDGWQQEARIEVVLRRNYLYVANTGAPLNQEGIDALLLTNSSPKRGNQIGRFGLGFKSLLRLAGSIDIFSADGALRFDPERCRREIRNEVNLAENAPAPSLRLAWSLDRNSEEVKDTMLSKFSWATTIVRGEIRNAEVLPHLAKEIRNFPSQFLLFLPIAVALNLDADDGHSLKLRREPDGENTVLWVGDVESRWRVAEKAEVRITNAAAISDATHFHARETVPLAWAMPLDANREPPVKQNVHLWTPRNFTKSGLPWPIPHHAHYGFTQLA